MVSLLAIDGGIPAVNVPQPHHRWPNLSKECITEVYDYLVQGKPLSIADGSGIIAELEQMIKEYFSCDYVLTTNSGSNALHSAYVALDLPKGSEVIAPVSTFHASITPAVHCGLSPVLVDVHNDTGNIDPDAIKEAITDKTSCIVITHMFGHPAEMNEIRDICIQHRIKLIEDCSHAYGSTYQGQKVGGFGDISIFSMQATKTVPAGEGGFLLTNSRHLYERACLVGHYRGRSIKEVHSEQLKNFAETGYGLKYRIHPLAAVIAKHEFLVLDHKIMIRKQLTDMLSDAIKGCNGMHPPTVRKGVTMGGFFGYRPRFEENKLFREGIPITVEEYIQILSCEGIEIHKPSVPPLDRMGIFLQDDIGLSFAKDTWKPRVLGPYVGCESFYTHLLSLPSFMQSTDFKTVNMYINGIQKVSDALSTQPKELKEDMYAN
ncbi:DegT/DnrJ/EryC1/StrS family aminotransferase [Paenibacillus lautus]|uniref:DegT/DnrJ/EryC1/StrS family aminotransferase n=1 Tax=Paenibacillus lautus TaxID=1401 RepID=UPI000BBD581C|nr:aminotransferase class I/II-fold pyridoxal phosphate-dependent enzyme [Paenibacillus lautus]PCL90072.1 hypothetical protein CPZ30_26360 [Paenibacillus lautus]